MVTESPPPPPRPVTPRPSPAASESAPVSGPSFLGLADAPPRNDVQYLLEDEESHSGGKRMLAALLMLVIAGGLVYWHWRRDGFPWSSLNSPHAAQAPVFSAASNAPAPAEPLPPASNEPTRSAAPPTIPSPDEAHMTNSDDEPPTPKPASPAPSKPATEQSPAAATPDVAKPPATSPNDAGAADTSSSESETKPEVSAPKPTVPAKPSRPAAVTKPTPAPDAASPDDQLVTDGEKYLYGNGVPANCARAQKNLHTAANHGNAKALSMLGTMYATGHCADRDLPNAYRSFAKALHQDPNNSRIQSDLEILWRQMSPDERQAATHGN